MTRDTETLFYNHRLIIDAKVATEPRAWLISKVNRISPNGICRITLSQDTFDQHKDYIEYDDDGNIVGMWADYYSSNITPTEVAYDEEETESSDDTTSTATTYTSKVTCSGRAQIKIGSSAKTLTVTFMDEDGNASDYQSGEWSFMIDGEDASSVLTLTSVSDGKVKVKFVGGEEYSNKLLTASFISGTISSSLDLEILPL